LHISSGFFNFVFMGKPKYIETPEKMWEYFLAYKNKVKSSPVIVQDFVGKDAELVHREREKPLTFIGFQNYLDDEEIITDVTDYFENKDNRYSDYIRICARIKRNIQEDQITGGMVNIYNPSITQRLNGLTDNVDLTTKGKEVGQPTAITVRIAKPDGDSN
jgi:hypothetical protein